MKVSIKQLIKANLRNNLSLKYLENQILNRKQLGFISNLIYRLIENKFWNSINNYLETELTKPMPIQQNFGCTLVFGPSLDMGLYTKDVYTTLGSNHPLLPMIYFCPTFVDAPFIKTSTLMRSSPHSIKIIAIKIHIKKIILFKINIKSNNF
jgi:hypothetical protein